MADKELVGRELDAAIAVRVMGEPQPLLSQDSCTNTIDDKRLGRAWIHTHCYERGDFCEAEPRRFSSDIAAAMEAVEAFRTRGYGVAITDNMGKAPWEVGFVNNSTVGGIFVGAGDTLQLAICRAALAVMESVKGEQS